MKPRLAAVKFVFAVALLVQPRLRAEEPGRDRPLPSDVSALPVPNENTVLTFSDEFKGPSLDTAKWNTWVPWPVIINHETGAYVSNAFEFIPGGGIRIRATRQFYLDQLWTTGELATLGKFSQAYGYFEMVARIPRGNGFWPAFWLMPFETAKQAGAEIDVMEILTEDTHTVHTTLHYQGVASGRSLGLGDASGGGDFADGYHSYAVAWRPQSLVWLIDGQEHFRIEGSQIPSAPQYLIANLAVGGSWPKPPDADSPSPTYLDIRSIRVYQYKDLKDSPVATPAFSPGPTVVTPAASKPGSTVDIRSSFTTAAAYRSMLVRVYVADYYGRKTLIEIDKTLHDLIPGTVNPVEVRCTIPNDLPPGLYTVAIKFTSDDAKLDSFLGCASRLEVVADENAAR